MRPSGRTLHTLALVLASCASALALPAETRAHAGIEELSRQSRAFVESHPEDPAAHLQRARVLQVARQWDAALAALDEAAARGAAADEVAALRGVILLDAGRPEHALAELDRVLAHRADAYGVLFERGRAWLALGRAEQASRDFRRAIAGMPAPRPEHVLARRDALLSLGRREEAVAALDEGMERVGRVVSLELAAVDLEVELGRHDAALGRLGRLLARQGDNPVWIARRGEILARAGRAERARAEYARALALIESRRGARRVAAFDELKRRLERELATSGGGKRS